MKTIVDDEIALGNPTLSPPSEPPLPTKIIRQIDVAMRYKIRYQRQFDRALPVVMANKRICPSNPTQQLDV